jgi:hypothetical protein
VQRGVDEVEQPGATQTHLEMLHHMQTQRFHVERSGCREATEKILHDIDHHQKGHREH